jgi:ApaG protein
MEGSETVTQGVRIRVETNHHPERSSPAENEWFFSYTIPISNEGARPVQLLTRHWIITDANGNIEEVRGPGVVGHQPVLATGQSFEYTSFCPLKTSFGTMHGTFQMRADRGETFDAEIAPFFLGEAHSIN